MTFERTKLQGKTPLFAPSNGDLTEETTMPAQHTVLGGIWPPKSLFNKFRRFCHQNEASGLTGYRCKPRSFTLLKIYLPVVLSSFAAYYWGFTL